MAMAMPVLPEVGSRIVLPGARSPRSSALAIMFSAGRSLTEPPGLQPSSLQRTCTPGFVPAFMSSTSGVLPMACSRFMLDPPSCRCGRRRRLGPAALMATAAMPTSRSTQRRSTSSGSSPPAAPAASMGWHEAGPSSRRRRTMASAWGSTSSRLRARAPRATPGGGGAAAAGAGDHALGRQPVDLGAQHEQQRRPAVREAWVRTSRSAASEVPASASGRPMALISSPSASRIAATISSLGAEVPVDQRVVDAGAAATRARSRRRRRAPRRARERRPG